ncbi:hypothetical protein GGU10DRAFT_381702 [Lentinula aff. detonsa]|uniref:Uncharacterized protein n=1 Tax=Lentinula aff. detonsa TaxID=2804958 RepID=A0AA38NIX2_9AGAR|nr:hypothetical protein GGU10DRAFT_381702 [Lentinula aff. detonsa]
MAMAMMTTATATTPSPTLPSEPEPEPHLRESSTIPNRTAHLTKAFTGSPLRSLPIHIQLPHMFLPTHKCDDDTLWTRRVWAVSVYRGQNGVEVGDDDDGWGYER